MALGRSDFSLIPQEMLWAYNAGDADGTIRIYKLMQKSFLDLDDYGATKKYYETVLKPLRVNLTVAELRGMAMSRKRLDEMESRLSTQMDVLEERMKDIAEDDNLNVRSPAQLKRVLYEKLKFQIMYHTPTGQPATAFDVLEKLNKEHPHEFLSSLIEYRKLHKVKSTYLNGFENFLDDNDRVHTSFVVGGTVSGRVSSREPPLATVPRDREYKIGNKMHLLSLRSLFIAPKNYRLIYCDYSQIELRIAAILSGEKQMLDAFAEGKDVHDTTARGIFGKDYVSVEMIEEAQKKGEKRRIEHLESTRKQQRNDAKRINFGLLYGAADKNLADQFNVPREVARDIFERYYKYYPSLANFLKGIPRLAQKHGVLVTPFGKRRVFYYPSDTRGDKKTIGELDRQAVNFMPQSCAAEVLFRAMNRICKRLTKYNIDAWPVNIVYDSLMFEVEKRRLRTVQQIVTEELLRPVKELDNQVFPAELGVGRSWNEAEHDVIKIA